ncbi:MAG: diacylglycerol kinase [Phototrophicales bacterium]|nr:MAG: diacylglycerol kinase [Phototrophicales bacterium]RMG75968.1 MAG: diacylglycerol kinase [Chloroflexota bacterium]
MDKKDPSIGEFDRSIFGAMRVDPKAYKRIYNRSFYERTKYAIAGLLFMLRHERSIRNVLKVGLVVLALGLWLRIEATHAAILFFAFGWTWTVETLNSAIEAVVDMVTQEFHPMAKVAKDVAASATFMASFVSVILILLLIGIPLLEKLNIL